MNQTLHILRKDLLHHRNELGGYLMLLVGYAVVIIRLSNPRAYMPPMVAALGPILTGLVAITWVVLIARAVQADSPVGDRSFWMTRPVRWYSLLAAKVLFVAVGIALPFLLMQCGLLFTAGLRPWSSPEGLLGSWLAFTLVNWLPFLVLSALFANIPQVFFSAVGALVTWAVLLLLLHSKMPEPVQLPIVKPIQACVFAAALIGVIVFQYAKRRTHLARLAILCAFVIFFLTFLGYSSPWGGNVVSWAVDRGLPNTDIHALRLKANALHDFDNPAQEAVHGEIVLYSSNLAWVSMPVQFNWTREDVRWRDLRVRYTVTGGGIHYRSAWIAGIAAADKPGLSFPMPDKVGRQVADAPSSLHLEVLAEQLFPVTSEMVTASAAGFQLPDGGLCSVRRATLDCRYAYARSQPMLLETGLPKQAGGRTGTPLSTLLPTMPPGTTPDPVRKVPLPSAVVVEGSPVKLTTLQSGGDAYATLDLPRVILHPR